MDFDFVLMAYDYVFQWPIFTGQWVCTWWISIMWECLCVLENIGFEAIIPNFQEGMVVGVWNLVCTLK